MSLVIPQPFYDFIDPISVPGGSGLECGCESLHVGPAFWWGDVSVPLTYEDVVYIQSTGQPPSGTFLGLSQGATSVNLQVKVKEYQYEGMFSPARKKVEAESMEITGTLLSIGKGLGNSLRRFFSGDSVLDGLGTFGTRTTGGLPDRSLMLISESVCNDSLIVVAMYNPVIEGFSHSFEKNRESIMPIRVHGIQRLLVSGDTEHSIGIGAIVGTNLGSGIPAFDIGPLCGLGEI